MEISSIEKSARAVADSAGPGRGDSSAKPFLSVVVPVTERPAPLAPLFQEYSAPLDRAGYSYEFVFVVEPWGLGLTESLRDLPAWEHRIRVLEVSSGVGESGMLTAAHERCRGEILLTLPAYRRVEPDELPRLVERVASGVDLASARREGPSNAWINRIQRRAFHRLLRTMLGVSFQDIASGVRAMRPRVLDEVPIYGDFFRFLPVLASREGLRVEEVPVGRHSEDSRTRVYAPRVYLSRLVDLIGLVFLVRFVRKPLRFFGLLGALTSGIGAVILAVLFAQRLAGQALGDRPLLLLGILLFVLGVQSIGIGLVGEIIVHLNSRAGRREYRTVAEESG